MLCRPNPGCRTPPCVSGNGQWPSGKTRWNKTHYNWLESIKFEQPWLRIVLQEYIDAIQAATGRVADLTAQMMQALPQWSLAPMVDSLVRVWFGL